MLKTRILAITPLLLFVFCLSAQNITEHGYRYTLHTNKGGLKPVRGEAMLANVDVYVGKTLLSSSKKNPNGVYRYDLPDSTAEVSHFPPLLDAGLMIGLGDSITVFQKVDDGMRQYLPPEEKEATEIRFEIVLLDIVSLKQKAAAARVLEEAIFGLKQKIQAKIKAYSAGLLDAELAKLPSGVKIWVEVDGNGDPVQEGEAIQVHYFGCLTNGMPFDNSFSRREPLQFTAGVGQMIPGFDEGVMNLRHGTKAYLFIPPTLGYGDEEAGDGMIPANSELIFYINIL